MYQKVIQTTFASLTFDGSWFEGINMQVSTCIKDLSKASGVSLSEVSRRLGKSRVYASNVGAPGRSPALATVADIADVLGYDVAIIDRETGEQVGTIVPPRQVGNG